MSIPPSENEGIEMRSPRSSVGTLSSAVPAHLLRIDANLIAVI